MPSNDNVKPMDLSIERPTSRQATVKWVQVPYASAYMAIIKGQSVLQDEWTLHASGETTELKVPMSLTPGRTYQVTLKAQKMRYKKGTVIYQTIRQATARFRAEFTKNELNELYDRARRHVSVTTTPAFDRIEWFYRNKPEEYFDHIYKKREGVMEVYLKDDNGDPASIINSRINGLFFATNIDPLTKKPPVTSNFGSKRFYVPAAAFFFDDSVKLYFADYYCNFRAHYVTLVMTTEGSETDKFCSENLISIDTYHNDFLFKQLPEVFVTRRIHIEVMYTENMDLSEWMSAHGAYFDNVEVSKGTSTPGGLPKKPTCQLCNLYDATPDSEDEIN